MACLYIDRLKSDFQRADHCVLRTNPHRKWSPQTVIKRLTSQKFDDGCAPEGFQVKNVSLSFRPKVPTIFTIGLQLDRKNIKDDNTCQLWNTASIKKFLKQYFSFIRRYRNYLHLSWKSTPTKDGDQWKVLSFTSFKSMISKCSKKLNLECPPIQKSDCMMLHYDFQFSTKNSSKLVLSDNQCIKQCQTKDDMEREMTPCNDTVAVDKIDNKQSNTEKKSVNVSSEEYNSQYTVYMSYSKQTKEKKNASVQTSETSKIRHRKSKKNATDQKENVACVATNTSSSKDIKTIFTTNYANFNSEKSKVNLEVLGTRYMKEVATRKRRNKKADKKSKKYDTEDSVKKRHKNDMDISTNTENSKETSAASGKKLMKSKKSERVKNADLIKECFPKYISMKNCADDNLTTIYQKYSSKSRNKSQTLIEGKKCKFQKALISKIGVDANALKATTCSDRYYVYGETDTRNEEKIIFEDSTVIKSNASSLDSFETSWESKNYLLEDKTSELMILGNVKKRLEEDYDDYFSLNDVDLEDDLFLDAIDTATDLEVHQPAAETKLDLHGLQDKPRRSKSMLVTTSVAKHEEVKKELRKQSIRTSLTYTSSIRFSNSDASRGHSSYHTSLRERECSPTSSIEYCTASNASVSRLQPSRNNSFTTLMQTYSLDANTRRDARAKKLRGRSCFFNDASLEDDEVFQDSREFLDHTLVNSYTMCCYQRNSTPNFSRSSKLITESLDSGILTDCSRDHFRTVSNDQFRSKIRQDCEEERAFYSKDENFLPTYDFNTDSSYSDDSLNRRVDVVVKKVTENLILTERKARTKLRRMENPMRYRQRRKRQKHNRQERRVSECIARQGSTCKFEASPRLNDDDWILSSSTPPLFSFSDSEMDHL